jgi:hypothetical protein
MIDTEFHSSISHIFVDLAYDGTIRGTTRPQLVVYRFSPNPELARRTRIGFQRVSGPVVGERCALQMLIP